MSDKNLTALNKKIVDICLHSSKIPKYVDPVFSLNLKDTPFYVTSCLTGEKIVVEASSGFIRAIFPYSYRHTCNAYVQKDAEDFCEILNNRK